MRSFGSPGAADWEAIKARFEDARALPPDTWADFLSRSFPDRPDLQAAVQQLLTADAAAGEFLEQPAVPPVAADDDALLLERVGPYELLERIGEGGMGEVYRARRADDLYHKHVAVKLVRRGITDVAFIRRFEQERETLASLDHPNIAKLLDGGTTPEGVPYFVMDWVDGAQIDRYAARQRLALRQRLQLFQHVCSAVQYAHRNLVVHRDLKPANIVVNSEGVPKLLDFGIARLLTPVPSDQRALTLTHAPLRMLTPEYASPEQLRGEPITTASDVYSLGRILFELITGAPPVNLADKRLDEILSWVSEVAPDRPSTVVRRAPSHDAPPDVAKTPSLLAGDLDAIVLMALRKEPDRRYASVEQLSADIDRYLNAQPVRARQGARAYRAAKFVRRHRLATAAALLLSSSILAGASATWWQAQRAEAERARAQRRFDEVRGLANSLLFELHDSIAALPGSTGTRQLLIQRALEYVDRLAAEGIPDAAFRRELAAAYRRVGDVQGNPYGANVGNITGAVESYRHALAVLTGDPDATRDVEHQRALAETHERLGDMLAISGDVAGGLAAQREALAVREGIRGADVRDRAALALSHSKVGQALYWSGRTAEALEHQREALAVREAAALEDPSDLRLQTSLISSFNNTGEVLLATGAIDDAVDAFRRAEELARRLLARQPSNPAILRQVAITHTKLGEAASARGEYRAAVTSHREALSVRSTIAAVDPRNAQAQRDTAISHIMLASALAGAQRKSEVFQHLDRGIGLFEEIARSSQRSPLARADLARAHEMAGSIWMRMADPSRAIQSFATATDLVKQIAASDAGDAEARHQLAASYVAMAGAHEALGSAKRDAVHWQRARDFYQLAKDDLVRLQADGMLRESESLSIASIASKISDCERQLESPVRRLPVGQ